MKRKFCTALVLTCLVGSAPGFSSVYKHRVVVEEGERFKAYEYASDSRTFRLVWESSPVGSGAKPHPDINAVLRDLDGDGRNELIATDRYGIFVWGQTGINPVYYSYDSLPRRNSQAFVLPIDWDRDGIFEFVSQRHFNPYFPDRNQNL